VQLLIFSNILIFLPVTNGYLKLVQLSQGKGC